jgi:hypothetical protein
MHTEFEIVAKLSSEDKSQMSIIFTPVLLNTPLKKCRAEVRTENAQKSIIQTNSAN